MPRDGMAGKPVPPKSRPKSSWYTMCTPAAEGRERFCEEHRLRSDHRLRAKLQALPADPLEEYFPHEDSDSDGGDHVSVDQSLCKVVNNDGGANHAEPSS